MESIKRFDAIVIGGGLAGTTVASELAALAPPGFRALLFEASEPGPGVAYACDSPSLYMNGAAGSMSAVPGDAAHLLRWLRTEPARALISRNVFGRYLAERFRDAVAGRGEFEVARAEVIDVASEDGSFTVVDARGGRYATRTVVFALGNFPPEDSFLPAAMRTHPGYVPDPWRYAPGHLEGDALLVGSGLTAMDAVALLHERGFGGRIHVVSRHGLIPAVEDPSARALDPAVLRLRTGTALELLRSVRAAARRHAAAGGDWRDIVESLRSVTPAIWSAWNLRERRRFLSHLAAFWAVHRYRVPPKTATAFESLERDGRIVRHRGRVADARATTDGLLEVTIDGSERKVRLVVAHAVNCTGPNGDYDRVRHPLVRSLSARGTIRPDALHLGMDVTPDLHVIDRRGRANQGLFALGPPVRGLWYETTAVPETRDQASRIARSIVASFRAAALEAAS
jgi:uncharacterized NAD(P)/FAD-binding protein YdhS